MIVFQQLETPLGGVGLILSVVIIKPGHPSSIDSGGISFTVTVAIRQQHFPQSRLLGGCLPRFTFFHSLLLLLLLLGMASIVAWGSPAQRHIGRCEDDHRSSSGVQPRVEGELSQDKSGDIIHNASSPLGLDRYELDSEQ